MASSVLPEAINRSARARSLLARSSRTEPAAPAPAIEGREGVLEHDLDCGLRLAPHGRLDQLARHRHRLARAALLGERPGQQRPGQQRADVPGAEVGRQHPGLPAEQRLGPRPVGRRRRQVEHVPGQPEVFGMIRGDPAAQHGQHRSASVQATSYIRAW